ncbi:HesA/MoeB/ThiF family protein [Actinophytocola sediminis]
MNQVEILDWRPRLRDSLVAEHVGNQLLFVSSSDRRARRFSATDVVLRLVPLLTGEHTVAELIERLCDSEETVVELCTALLTLREGRLLSQVADPLAEHGTLTAGEAGHYDRQLRLFQEFCDAGTIDGDRGYAFQERLKAATVVICGVGGLGSFTAASLAAAGVGTIIVCDDDIVEENNLHRQHLYTMADVGKRKAVVLSERLMASNPHITVTPVVKRLEQPADLREIAAASDFVVNCADWPGITEMAELVTEACWPHTPHLIGGAYAYHVGMFGLTVIPGTTACWYCLLAEGKRKLDRTGMRRLKPKTRYAGVIGAQSGIVGNTMSWETIRFLAGMPTALTDRWVQLDFWTMAVLEWPVPRSPDCPRRA